MLANGLGLSTDSPDRRLLFEVAWEREQRQREKTSKLARLLGPIPEMGKDFLPYSTKDYSKPQVLVRMEEVADCTVWMLNEASKLKLDQVGAEEILDTTQAGSSLFRHLEQDDRWSHAVRLAMENKWNIVSLYRMTGDLERAFEAIQEIRNLSVCPEQYMPRAFRRIGELRPAYNLLIVPHIGALLALSTHNSAVADTAFFYPDVPDFAPYIKSLTDHFNLLFAETTQLARTYKPRSPEWEDTLTSICQLEADEFLADNSIDNITMPSALYNELLEKSLELEKTYSPTSIRRLKTHHILRREAFERHVKCYKYLTIMPRRSLTEALQNDDGFCRYPVDNHPPHNKYVIVDKRQAIEHIEYLIRDLRCYDNYEIALIEDNHPYSTELMRTPWRVKGEAAALIEPYTESKNGQGPHVISDLEITGTSIVRAFRQQFLDIWNTIAEPDKAKQKENIIAELSKLLEVMKGKPEYSRS
jgi:hypothetical protein